MKGNDCKAGKVSFRLNEADLQLLDKQMQRTTCKTRSEFLRNKVLAVPIAYTYRNASLDECTEELAQLKQELKTVGYHFQTALRRLSVLPAAQANAQWMISFEIDRRRVLKQIDKISEYLHEFSSNDSEYKNN